MKFIPLTQGRIAIVDDEDYERLNQYKWHYCDGYAMRRTPMINGIQGKMILMHREVVQTPEGLFTDHADEDKLNNQKYNLRTATKSQNGFNRGKSSNNTSGFKGVVFNKANKNYRADIHYLGKKIYIGSFETATQAAQAYDTEAKNMCGEFAKPNLQS